MSEQSINKTVTEVMRDNLRTMEKEVPAHVHNVKLLFTVQEHLTREQRCAMDNFLIGWLCGDVPSDKWAQAIKYADAAMKHCLGIPNVKA